MARSAELVSGTSKLFAFGFWLWAAFITFGAGLLGSGLNTACDEDDGGCKDGFPSLLKP